MIEFKNTDDMNFKCDKCTGEVKPIEAVIFNFKFKSYTVCPDCADKIEKFITEKETTGERMVFTVDPYRIIADYYFGKRPGYLAVQCSCGINLYFPKRAEHGDYLLTCPKCGQVITYHT